MFHRQICLFFGGLFIILASSSADIIWSEDVYLRAYHEISSIDFNQDGIKDFVFSSVTESGYEFIWIEPNNGQTVVADDISLYNQTAIAFDSGASIASHLSDSYHAWSDSESLLFVYGTAMGSPNPGGPFGDGTNYLGIAFNVDDSTHYGWIQMSQHIGRPSPDYEYLYVHGWAWESDPDTPIVTGAIPEPSSGALVIVGALSLWHLRRTRQRKGINFHVPTSKYRIKTDSSENPDMW